MATLKERYRDWIPIRNGWSTTCAVCDTEIPLGATVLWKQDHQVRCVACVGGRALAFYARGIPLAWFRYYWATSLGLYGSAQTD